MFACKASGLPPGVGNGQNLVGFLSAACCSLVGKQVSVCGKHFLVRTPTIRYANIIMLGGRDALQWKGQQIQVAITMF